MTLLPTAIDDLTTLVGGRWHNTPGDDWVPARLRRRRLRRLCRGFSPDGNLAAVPDQRVYCLESETPPHSVPLVDVVPDDLPSDLCCLQVVSPQEAASRLAERCRDRFSGKVLAVTGSVAKTTTKFMIEHVLSKAVPTYCAPGNANDLPAITCQLTTLRDQGLAIFEAARIGLPETAQLLRPNIVVVTAISEAHLELTGSLRATAELKASLLRSMTPGGTAVLNTGLPFGEVFVEAAKQAGASIVTYGETPDADVSLSGFDLATSHVTAIVRGHEVTYPLGVTGHHNAVNSLVPLAVLPLVDRPVDDAPVDLSTFELVAGRGDTKLLRLGKRQVALIDESYNANPMSMRAALERLSDLEAPGNGRKIVVIGDMLELGEDSERLHTELAEPITRSDADRVYLVGKLMNGLWAQLPESMRAALLTDPEQATHLLEAELRDGDLVMLKSSRASGLRKVVRELERRSRTAERVRLLIRGPRVHGVGFRAFVRRQAKRRGLSGWVRNRTDGTVEAVLAGPEPEVLQAVLACREGPRRANVRSLSIRRFEREVLDGFRMRRARKIPSPSLKKRLRAARASLVGR